MLALSSCGPSVKNRYEKLSDARRDNLFEKGWLPDILPPSSINIRVENDLDLNISEGEFSFIASEWPLLKAKLVQGSVLTAPFSNWSETIKKYQANGYSSWNFNSETSTWMFFCKAEDGYCSFIMWVVGNGLHHDQHRAATLAAIRLTQMLNA